MAKIFSIEELRAMTLEKRVTVYNNCLRREGDPDAEAIIKNLKKTGLPYTKEKSVANGDPVYRRMEIIINNPANVELMLDASAKGRPSLEPIDPLIAKELGKDYGPHNESTVTAGYLVGQKMYALGYEKMPPKALSQGCVAKTAAIFRKRQGT